MTEKYPVMNDKTNKPKLKEHTTTTLINKKKTINSSRTWSKKSDLATHYLTIQVNILEAGFTGGRGLQLNLLILNYCIWTAVNRGNRNL